MLAIRVAQIDLTTSDTMWRCRYRAGRSLVLLDYCLSQEYTTQLVRAHTAISTGSRNR